MKWAIQLFTLREETKTPDALRETLSRVKAMGYDGVEFAGLCGMTAEEARAALEESGLAAVGMHQMIDRLENDLDEVLQSALAVGSPTVTMAFSPANTPEEVARTVRVLQKAKQAAAPLGIEILYHNHSHEFAAVENVPAIDSILSAAKLEADTFWIYFAGVDPAEFLLHHAECIGLVHLKDGVPGCRVPRALGEGENNIAAILRAAQAIGMEWGIVENDEPAPTGLADAQRSIHWLKAHT